MVDWLQRICRMKLECVRRCDRKPTHHQQRPARCRTDRCGVDLASARQNNNRQTFQSLKRPLFGPAIVRVDNEQSVKPRNDELTRISEPNVFDDFQRVDVKDCDTVKRRHFHNQKSTTTTCDDLLDARRKHPELLHRYFSVAPDTGPGNLIRCQ
mgnify:CR=1 FL=1